MSFSNEVKNEIFSTITDKDKRFACLYGMLLYCKSFSKDMIIFQTENAAVSRLIFNLIKDVFQNKVHAVVDEKNDKYICSVSDKDEIKYISDTYSINLSDRKINKDLIVNNSMGAFTAGIFLSCGSVNDPSKEYHLEYASPCIQLAEELREILNVIGINAKIFERKNMSVVYIKESESIEDTLTYMGAQQCTIELINVKIFKDVRNKANRLANCDNANIDKVVNAAIKQTEDIKYIQSQLGLKCLTPELKEVAEIRLENSDMSLQEIGNSLKNPISRSGVNHRFKKIAEIADRIREGKFTFDEKK